MKKKIKAILKKYRLAPETADKLLALFNQELEKREKEWFKNIKPSGKGDYYTISATSVKKLKGGI